MIFVGTSGKQWDVLWAGAITWEHPDNLLRVVSHNSKPLVNLLPPNPYDKVDNSFIYNVDLVKNFS